MATAEREFRRYQDPFDEPYWEPPAGQWDDRRRARPAFDDPPPEPPPAQRESLVPYVAFLIAVAVVSLGIGYALNRAVGSAQSPGPRPGITAAPTAPGPGLPTSPSGGGTSDGTDDGTDGGTAALTAEQVALQLAAAGLPLRTTAVYTATTDPDGLLGRTNGYTSKIAFADPRVGRNEVSGLPADAIERGGQIEVFADAAKAQSRARKVQTVTADRPDVTEYTYVHGRIVLRLSLVLTEAMAQRYQTALTSIGA